MRLMFITPRRAAGAFGGREQLSALHERCLAELISKRLTVRRLDPAPAEGIFGVTAALGGRIDGVSAISEQAVVGEIIASGIDTLWLDGTNLGRLAAAVKRAAPAVRVISFAHNIEARFFLGGLRHHPSPRALGVLAANAVAERLAVRKSDQLIALSNRDSAMFGTIYGRTADSILPMAIEDRGPPGDPGQAGSAPSLLFVGGAFYANLHAMRWFAKHVAPRLAVRTIVVGRGFEAYRGELEAGGRIEVVGGVDDLAPYYAAASAVIAPIFDGSGMKTKVAEALMHGKPVIGTREALSGYEGLATIAPSDTAEQFIAAIAVAIRTTPHFSHALRHIYEQNYSPAAAVRALGRIIG